MLLCNPLDFKLELEALVYTLGRSQEEGARSADLRSEEAAIGEGEEKGSKTQTLEN